jgi:hypothetical protein
MRDAWAQARDVANAWDAKVNENPKCDKISLRALLKPAELEKLRQRIATYDV